MPISVKCPDCGKALKAPDALAGQKAKCPDCGAVVKIPSAAWADTPGASPDADGGKLEGDDADTPAEDSAARKPCPMCGELIVASAVKCRFCGEILDPAVRRRERQQTLAGVDDQLTGVDIVLCVLCFPLGCVVGIVALIRGQTSRGLKMVGFSVLMPFIWGAIRAILK